MSYIYPKAPPVKVFKPLAETAALRVLIVQREQGESEAVAKSRALAGSDDVAGINRLWGEIEKDRTELARVNPADSADEAEYVAALQAKVQHLDPQKWADGTLAAAEVADFAALKTKLTTGP